jgi:Ankyrin repeats (3 copies)
MAKPKKKLLPKNFKELLEKGVVADAMAVFDSCELDARGGYAKQTALAFDEMPDELAKWLVDQGADLQATDTWGHTPLHARSRSIRGRIKILIDLGADIHSTNASVGTPLHAAADSRNVENATLLIQNDANVHALNAEHLTPLELALRGCSNIDIEKMAALAQILLAAGAQPNATMKGFVEKIGQNFEFHRAGFNPEFIPSIDDGLAKLYSIFQVSPVARRQIHQGSSAITVKETTWQKQHQELWELLVPSTGHAETVQGEVIRIPGRIIDELDRNGGANWNQDFKNMAAAFIRYIASAEPLSASDISEMTALVASLGKNSEGPVRMAQLAVKWVLQNPQPIKMDAPSYKR